MSQTVPVIRPPPNPLHARAAGRKLALSIPTPGNPQPNSGGRAGGLSLNTSGLGGSGQSAQSNGRTPPRLQLNVSAAGNSQSQFPTLSYLRDLSDISRPNGNIQQVSGPGMEGVVPMDIAPQEDISNLDVEQLNDDGWRRVLESNRLIKLGSLGEGAGGAVTRCMLQGGKTLFALKVITTDPNPEVMKQIRRELAFNKDCSSPHICKYYGAVVDERSATISIAMEYCEGGSLDSVYREVKRLGGRTGERVLGKIAEGVLNGLTYLSNNRIIHRDIKPSNILLCRNGQVKLCDFGVSGELLGSKGDANTFIGTSAYMAPERIQGHSYTITSDVWSLGVTLLEVAQHAFPFPGDGSGGKEGGPAALIELLTYIVTQPIPELKDEPEVGVKWSDDFKFFIKCCLEKNTSRRATPWRLLDHPWMVSMRSKKVNMEKFLAQVWDWKD